MEIELYTIKSFTGSALKSKLEAALAADQLPYAVREIHNVEEFIKAGLNSIPAIRFGSRIIEYHEDQSFEDTIQKTLDMIHSEKEHYILVPVDFTPESIHALRYARILAQHMDMQITVMHVHQTLFDPVTGSAFDQDMMANNRKRLDEMLVDAGWDKIQAGGHVPVHTHFESGDITTHLNTISADPKYDLIVMSTKSDDNVFRRLFGTVSSQVSQKINKPVLIVPPYAHLAFPSKVVVGLTESLMDSDAFDHFLDMADRHKFYLEFIYANNDDHDFQRIKSNLQQVMKSYPGVAGYAVSPIPYNEDSLHEDLLVSASQLKADMLVLVTKHRSFFENMGHRSITKRALHHPILPVMVLHEQVKA